jgi:hypothetical protein
MWVLSQYEWATEQVNSEQRDIDYIHIDGASPSNGSENKFQLKTPRSTGMSESRQPVVWAMGVRLDPGVYPEGETDLSTHRMAA